MIGPFFAISLEESQRFAQLSADFNPLHVDPVRARRLPLGGTVVHGVSIVMRALDTAFARHGGGPLENLQVQFDSAIATNQPFEIETERAGQDITVRIRSTKGAAQKFSARLSAVAMDGPPTQPPDPSPACRDLGFDAAASASGVVPLGWDDGVARALYPNLAAATPAWQLAALAATTRIVGMECPGLHSVYASLEASFGPANGPQDALAWRVTKVDKRFRLLTIEAVSAIFSARIEALVRPAPVAQPSYAEVRDVAAAGRFTGRRALVIGGGRGLGEVAAKILAAGGADVAITYAAGASDADAVVADIRSGGGMARTFMFDVHALQKARPDTLADGWAPTDLLYFASPQITLTPGAPWNGALFQSFCSFFVTGFAEAVSYCDQALGTAGQPLRIFYPSTVYVTKPPPGGAEYAASKAAAEAYCAFLRARRPKTMIDSPRLPRMLTDQTSSVRTGPMEPPLGVLLPILN